MRTQGVDVSHWEGLIDWQEAARWVPFVYYKCTDGLNMFDPTFKLNQAGCQAHGIPHAPYHYFQPSLDPTAQANWFISNAGKLYKRYVLDVEEDPILGEIVPQLQAFLLRCEQLTGIKPAIYTSPGFWNTYVKPKPAWARSYDLLVAHYTADHLPIIPIGWDHWAIWQYTDDFYFPGCSSAADGDWFNGTLSQTRQWFGNYKQVDPPYISHTKLRSQFDQLHVRKNPSKTSKEVAHLSKGETVELEDLGGKDVWVKHERGWTCIEKDGYRYMEVVK